MDTKVDISLPDGTRLVISNGILSSTITAKIEVIDSTSNEILNANSNLYILRIYQPLNAFNTYRDFLIRDTNTSNLIRNINGQATITIPYQDSNPADGKVDQTDFDEKYLHIAHFNESNNWEIINSVVDTNNNTVSAQINKFSIYCLVYCQLNTHETDNIIAFPNPCYPEKGQVVKFGNIPQNSNAQVNIYTIAGELVLNTISEVFL